MKNLRLKAARAGMDLSQEDLAKKCGVEMPITEQLYSILFEGRKAKEAVGALMQRPSRPETEQDFLNK